MTRTTGPPDGSKDGNRLIDRLPLQQRNSVQSYCELVNLEVGTVLCEEHEPWHYAHFPVAGSVSLVRSLTGHRPLETASTGREGMLGATLALNIKCAPQRAIAQMAGQALRIRTTKLKEALQEYPELASAIQHYLYFILLDASRTTACTHFHDTGKRLARTLLLAHDRALTDELHLTHQTLADLLGVQRGAVTIAATKLQREGTIRYNRGKISIINRKELEASSCECYALSIDDYKALLS